MTEAEPEDPSSPVDDATGLTCPDCGGALWAFEDGSVGGFRCHVGHTYSIEAMLEQQTDAVERALWAAVRALEERAGLLLRLARRASGRGQHRVQERFEEQAREIRAQADVIREALSATTETPDGLREHIA